MTSLCLCWSDLRHEAESLRTSSLELLRINLLLDFGHLYTPSDRIERASGVSSSAPQLNSL